MLDFLIKIEQGRLGKNEGIKTHLPGFCDAIGNLQPATYYGVMGLPKAYKTKWTDTTFILYPYLLNDPAKLDYTYYSWEVNRIQKIADWVAFFFWIDYNIKYTPNHVLFKGEKRVKDNHIKLIEEIVKNRIIPLLGDYNEYGVKTKNGIVDFIEEKTNPTGCRNYLIHKAEQHGESIWENYTTKDDFGKPIIKKRRIGFTDKEPKFRCVITDHIRLCHSEKGLDNKGKIDKLSEYHMELVKDFGYTCVDLVHGNRSISDNENTQSQGGRFLRPHPGQSKDSGNLAENVNCLISLFNPYEYPHIKAHFDYTIDKFISRNVGKYRSLHILSNRNGEAPLDFFMTVDGGNNQFREIPNPKDKDFDKFMVDFNNYEKIGYGEV